ncbi:hypothetical protein SNOG_04994 [Parastagonospora nodorum SN15]|uniref:Uncharacterized protein n=1 Tax=Phaeosphaeria nodorum (strain SN15 / ATCC MYA-4574 / FGSC 10173) TaxID=321614 RepID=Q0UTC0_PHANO|nr:hypothetical protein SNOG_04994 [Parastagonospora nodorum SN15]EAT87385.1 hypothetical protein SNOG_04994 [Parastagonospora nodorum SN15]
MARKVAKEPQMRPFADEHFPASRMQERIECVCLLYNGTSTAEYGGLGDERWYFSDTSLCRTRHDPSGALG